jgi:hypothetical protein
VLRIGTAAAIVAALAATAFAGVAEADTTIAHIVRPSLVNALNGTVVWSAYDNTDKLYRLTAFRGGRVTTLPVPPSDSVFDADLGVDAAGKLTVVYSRCTQPREKLPFIMAPATADCDLYRYRFGDPGEQKLTAFSRVGISEFLPSIWGNRIAFARTSTNASGGNCVTAVWLGDIASGRQRRLATGTLGNYKSASPCHLRTTPTSIDVRARVIAFAWYFAPYGCDDGSQLWLIRLPKKPKLIESRCSGYRFTPVSLTRSRLFEMSFGSPTNRSVGYFHPNLRRFDLRSHRYYEALQPDGDSFAVSDGATIYALRRSTSGAGNYDVVSRPLRGFKRSRRDRG